MTEGKEDIVRKSPIYSRQQESGATFCQVWGWEMAGSYEDAQREALAVRQGVGVIDLSHHGAMKVGGKEVVPFLQGLVTNDVKTLPRGEGMRAAFLTGHGKVRAFCYILRLEDEFLILNDPQTHEKVFKYVFPFSYAGDFKVDETSDEYQLLSVQGPQSLLVMKESCFEPIPNIKEYGWIETLIAGYRVLVVRHSRTGELGYDILVSKDGLQDVWDFILLKGKFHSIIPFGLDALEILRIEAGIAVYGIDITEQNMMLESGLEDAVSFTKGCYTGQEAVAMATYRGHISKKLSGLSLAGTEPVKVGDKVFKGEKEIGLISSTTKSVTLDKYIAFSCLKYGYFDEGLSVQVKSENRVCDAAVVKLPFLKQLAEKVEIK